MLDDGSEVFYADDYVKLILVDFKGFEFILLNRN
jgi:hypothetical protein